MFSKISVLVPTRQRLPQLEALIRSYLLTTTAPATAELVFRIDDDDVQSAGYLSLHAPWAPLVIGPRLEGYRSLPLFFDEMCQIATGDLLMTGNDDIVFRTTDWSNKILAVANRYPDGVFDLGVKTFNPTAFPWAIVSRKAVRAMGGIHPREIYWGDIYLRDVMATFGRAIPVPEVHIDHDWMGHRPDQVFLEAQQGIHGRWTPEYTARHRACVQQAAERLKALVA